MRNNKRNLAEPFKETYPDGVARTYIPNNISYPAWIQGAWAKVKREPLNETIKKCMAHKTR